MQLLSSYLEASKLLYAVINYKQYVIFSFALCLLWSMSVDFAAKGHFVGDIYLEGTFTNSALQLIWLRAYKYVIFDIILQIKCDKVSEKKYLKNYKDNAMVEVAIQWFDRIINNTSLQNYRTSILC